MDLGKRVGAEELKIEIGGNALGVTVSIGVATFPRNALGTQELIREADRILYQAKADGKNCVRASNLNAAAAATENPTAAS